MMDRGVAAFAALLGTGLAIHGAQVSATLHLNQPPLPDLYGTD